MRRGRELHGGAGRVDVLIDERTEISRALLMDHLDPGSPVKLSVANLFAPGKK